MIAVDVQLIGTYATYLYTTPLEPFSTVVTLIFVLLVTSVKEGLEDIQRAKYVCNCVYMVESSRADRDENIRKATIVVFNGDGSTSEKEVETQEVCHADQLCMYA